MNGTGKWKRSFRYAIQGIQYAMITQMNMRFHFFIAILILAAAFILRLDRIDCLFLILAIALVMVTELINTAIEKAVDLAMPEQHPVAKIAKDVSAAAVLVAAVFAAVAGIIIFSPPVARLLQSLIESWG